MVIRKVMLPAIVMAGSMFAMIMSGNLSLLTVAVAVLGIYLFVMFDILITDLHIHIRMLHDRIRELEKARLMDDIARTVDDPFEGSIK